MGANLRPAWGKMWDRFKKKKNKRRKYYNWQPPEYFIFMTFTTKVKWAWNALTFQVSDFLKIREPSTISTHFHFFWTGSLQKLISIINFCKCTIAVLFYQRRREYDFPKHSPIKPLMPEVSSLPSAVPVLSSLVDTPTLPWMKLLSRKSWFYSGHYRTVS